VVLNNMVFVKIISVVVSMVIVELLTNTVVMDANLLLVIVIIPHLKQLQKLQK